MSPVRWLPLRWAVIAAALALPTAASAQLQINQNFVTQGPAPSFGPIDAVHSADAPPNGSVAGAVGPVVADPLDANTFFVGTVNGGIWKTTNGGTTWTPLTDKQASLSIASLSFDPTDPTRRTLIAGTGLTSNGTVCSSPACFFSGSGGLRNGLLYSQDGGNTWASLAEGANASVVGVAARGSVIVAGTFEISLLGGDKNAGALFRSTDRGATFTPISGGVGTGLPDGPVSSIVGDPNNPNRLYAAVTAPAPNAAGNLSTAIFVSNDTGATWTQVFGAAQSGGTIQGASQTVIKIATGPGGAIAAGVVNLATGTVTGLFWSGNSGATWTQLPTPTLNNGNMAPNQFAIAIDPNNTNLVYVAGDRIAAVPFTVTAFRINANTLAVSSITEANTANGSSVHADARDITFDANGRLILTGDGTIYARTSPQNDTGVWTRISGNLSAFETYQVGYDAVGRRLITAAQDSGVTIQSARNSPLWNSVKGADGINAFVNDVTLAATGRSVFYATTQDLDFPVRIIVDAQGNVVSPNTTGFGLGTDVTCNGITCRTAVTGSSFKSPWVNNRIDPTRMAFGGTSVFVTQDTLTGAQGPAANTVDLTLTDLGPVGAPVTNIAYGTRDNPNMLVAGTNGGLMLWQSTTAAAGSIVPVPAYAAAGGITPTGVVLDPRSQLRYFVADNTNLFGTTNQGGLFTNLTANLPTGIIRPTALEFISNNGVNALLTGGINDVANAQSTIAIADSNAAGVLSNWRPFGTGLPNSQVSALSYNPAADVLAVGTFGRGVFTLYDVTSYFPQATVLQFGLADNDSMPDASFLTNGTVGNRALIKYGIGTLTIAGDATYTGGTTINAGTLQLGNGGTSGSILGNVLNNGVFAINRSDTFTFGGVISGTGAFAQIGPGTTVLTAANTYSGGTLINGGVLAVAADANLGAAAGGLAFGGGMLQFLSGFATNRAISLNAGGGAFDTNGNDAALTGVIGGSGGLTKIGAGALMLTAANAYIGPTTVSAGALVVNGSIANSAVTVNNGGILAGTGTVGATTINSGGTFAPGNSPGTMTVAGNLAFQSGALYLVQVNPSTASSTNVTAGGSAALAGTVGATFASGSYVSRMFTILSAGGGLNGTTFNTLATSNLPAGFTANLSYTNSDVILNLIATLGQPSGPSALGTTGLSENQRNVANALNTFFNNGGALPPNFVTIFGLTGGNLANALSQLSGEAATGAQRVGFQLTDQFLNLMLDPFVDGRTGMGGVDRPALGFAPEREPLPEDIALAYAKVLKAPPKPLTFEQRWTVWGAGYGGSNRTDGDLAVVGSHDLSARTAGGAAGLDYHLSPGTVVGFALAGAGTDWSLSQGLGGGKSDAFQAGIYGATKSGPAYLAAAFAFTNHWMSTDRISFAGDHLTADFNAQSYGGRLEGGYRFATPYGGITPYAAIQAQSFHTPSYTETGVIPNGFALAFGSRDATDTRSELGARFDRVLAVYSRAVLALRGRVAWAHDWVSDPTLMPLFQTLPGASFIVNGALPVKDSALASAGGELRLANGLTLLAKFDGEFASRSNTYAGTGTIRYRW
jgi:autotransporter-associated beta strand protein